MVTLVRVEYRYIIIMVYFVLFLLMHVFFIGVLYYITLFIRSQELHFFTRIFVFTKCSKGDKDTKYKNINTKRGTHSTQDTRDLK
jgi:capsular polysaccharide biosynthesis protein